MDIGSDSTLTKLHASLPVVARTLLALLAGVVVCLATFLATEVTGYVLFYTEFFTPGVIPVFVYFLTSTQVLFYTGVISACLLGFLVIWILSPLAKRQKEGGQGLWRYSTVAEDDGSLQLNIRVALDSLLEEIEEQEDRTDHTLTDISNQTKLALSELSSSYQHAYEQVISKLEEINRLERQTPSLSQEDRQRLHELKQQYVEVLAEYTAIGKTALVARLSEYLGQQLGEEVEQERP